MSAVIATPTADTGGYERNRTEYWEKGYTTFKGLFAAAEVPRWISESQRLWALPGLLDDLNLRSEFRKDLEGQFVVDRLDPVLDISPVFRDLVFDQRLGDALRALFREPVTPLKCKLIRKDPNTCGYLHHQDFLYWRWLQLSPDALCSVAIPLHPSNKASGGIEFFPRAHHSLIAAADGNPDADFDIARIDVRTGETPDLEPGDVLVFHSLTPHRSGANTSDHPRTLLLPSFAAGSDPSLYSKYYLREVRRRCNDVVGFERYEKSLGEIEQRCADTLTTD